MLGTKYSVPSTWYFTAQIGAHTNYDSSCKQLSHARLATKQPNNRYQIYNPDSICINVYIEIHTHIYTYREIPCRVAIEPCRIAVGARSLTIVKRKMGWFRLGVSQAWMLALHGPLPILKNNSNPMAINIPPSNSSSNRAYTVSYIQIYISIYIYIYIYIYDIYIHVNMCVYIYM